MPSSGVNRATSLHGQKRSNALHAWSTNTKVRLYNKDAGQLYFLGHGLIENATVG